MRNSNSFPERAIRIRPSIEFLLVLAVFCLASAAHALDPTKSIAQYVYDRWGPDRGFIGGRIYAICQSSDGLLWIGAERGLVRFDGFSFTLIQRPVPGTRELGPVRGLALDADGNLWIRPEGPHIFSYRDGKFTDQYPLFIPYGATFSAMTLNSDGALFLSAIGGRTFRYLHGHLDTFFDQDIGIVLTTAVARDQSVWFGTRDGGLFRADGGKISAVAEEPDNAGVNALTPSVRGGMWIGTDRGLQYWDGKHVLPVRLPLGSDKPQVLSLLDDRDANAWIGTDHGLSRIATPNLTTSERMDDDSANQVTAIYEDQDGDIWFGDSHGLGRLRDGMFATYGKAQGLPSESNGPIYLDPRGRTWFAPTSGGLYWLEDGRVGEVTAAGLQHDVVYSIAGGNDEIWVGRQHGGLTELIDKGNAFSARTYTTADGLPQDSIFSVCRKSDGTVWAATLSAGVSRFENGRFTNFANSSGFPSNTANSIIEASDGTMWFATPSGLASFAKGRWSRLSEYEGLPSSNVSAIAEDSTHTLWIATAGGLAYLSSGRVQPLRNLPEVLREQIDGIAEDAMGSLWMSTSDHVLQVSRDPLVTSSLEESDVHVYGMDDGLLGNEGVSRDRSVVADQAGRVWFSLNRGLSVADPRHMAYRAEPINVRIESMSEGGNRVDLDRSVKLSAGLHSLVFKYAGTDLAVPERVRFRYMLEGTDRRWSDSTVARQVTYSNLGYGKYQFRIIASNSDGLWNGPETVVAFSIEPAFWQTWTFRGMCLAAFSLAILGIYRLRIYQLTHRLNVRFQDRLAERTRIAQELHDTLLQGVLSASLQLDLAEDQLPADSPAKPLIGRVLELMRRVTEEGRNALHGLRKPEGDRTSLEMAFSRMRQEFALDSKISYRVLVNGVPRPIRPAIRDEVYRIGREAIVNAFLHAQAANIEVEIEYATRHFRIVVRDDGRGIDPEVAQMGREGHWGLTGMRSRSEGIGATLKLRSRSGAGTEVELIAPDRIAFENEDSTQRRRWLVKFRRSSLRPRAESKEAEHERHR